MPSKKKKRHFCTHHPGQYAQGTCLKCGKWLCSECSLVVRGVTYCCTKECRPEELTAEPEPAGASEQKQVDRWWRTLLFRSSLTISLCAVVFIVVIIRDVWKLKNENAMLRTSRLTLIEQLKSMNREREVSEVPQDTIHSNQPLPIKIIQPQHTETTPPKQNTRQLPPLPSYRPPSTFSGNFINGSSDRNTISLTFDGGATANTASAIIDTLASRAVTATMFLTGSFIRHYPDITRTIVAHGHECGNHTFTHPHLTTYPKNRLQNTLPTIDAEELHYQLQSTNELFRLTTDNNLEPLWRAPYGEYNRELCSWALAGGYLHIGWRQGRTWREGLDSNDWVPDAETPGYHTPEEFLDKIVALACRKPFGINGGIILMHLGTQRKNPQEQVHTVLGRLIDTLRTEGYRFVTVSEMATASGIDLASLKEKIHIQ